MTTGAALAARLRAALPPTDDEWTARADHAPAAVLVPVLANDGEPHVGFIKRRADLRQHGGQYAFPGGRRDLGETPVQCALREFEEELGLAGADVDVLGALPCHSTSLGYLVHPVVGEIASLAGARLQASEVEFVLEVPLRALTDAARWQWRTVLGPRGPRVSPFFTYEQHVIWGLTARVARDLVERWP